MLKKVRLTVGIPAYNEEGNIDYLLVDLSKQKLGGLTVLDVVVFCDGCTDKTEAIARDFKSLRLRLLKSRQRKGIGYGLNQIMRKCDSDVLVILNADIRIKDTNFLQKIAAPILQGKADLTSVSPTELEAKNFLEKSLLLSNKIKKNVFETYKKGNNVYTCHGQARAFSKRLYMQMVVRSNIGEDAYSYLYCIKNGYRYRFVDNSRVYYKLPGKLKDHMKQSMRFFNSKRELANYFDGPFLKEQYALPLGLVLFEAVKYCFRHPLQLVSYSLLVISIKGFSLFATETKDLWEVSKSTKYLEAIND